MQGLLIQEHMRVFSTGSGKPCHHRMPRWAVIFAACLSLVDAVPHSFQLRRGSLWKCLTKDCKFVDLAPCQTLTTQIRKKGTPNENTNWKSLPGFACNRPPSSSVVFKTPVTGPSIPSFTADI